MIACFTDFGRDGPYGGQMRAVLHRLAPGAPVVDLFVDAPAFDPFRAAYLLAAYATTFPAEAVFLCVVDPGVGSDRAAVAARLDGRWFVGPDNGLLAIVTRRAQDRAAFTLDPAKSPGAPARPSVSFHGRDLFAPAAALLARGETPAWPARAPETLDRRDWPDALAEIVYIDSYGNAMTGLRPRDAPALAELSVAGRTLPHARVFAEAEGAFWYENANGLVEIALPGGRVADALDLTIGTPVTIITA